METLERHYIAIDQWSPLYPDETLLSDPEPLRIVRDNAGLRLRALRDFSLPSRSTDGPDGPVPLPDKEVRAGDEWLFLGPATYIPRVEVEVVDFKLERTMSWQIPRFKWIKFDVRVFGR